MRSPCKELTLRTALADPLIRTVMAADNVDPVQLESMLRRIGDHIAATRPAAVRRSWQPAERCCEAL